MKRQEALPPRLEKIASMLPGGTQMVDIGTDHAFLPIALVQRGVYRSAVAADVRTGPLQVAAQHIREAGLSGRIRPCLSDGFDALQPEDCETVVMAGMGGFLISELLERGFREGKLAKLRYLLVQPQSEPDRVRRTLHACGLRIDREQMALDRGKYYLMIGAVPGEEQYREEEYLFGRDLAARRDPVFAEWLTAELAKNRAIMRDLEQQPDPSPAALERLGEIRQQSLMAERILWAWKSPSE